MIMQERKQQLLVLELLLWCNQNPFTLSTSHYEKVFSISKCSGSAKRKEKNNRQSEKLPNSRTIQTRCLHFCTHAWQFQRHVWCSLLLFRVILLTPICLLVWNWATVLSLRSQIKNCLLISLQPKSFCDAGGTKELTRFPCRQTVKAKSWHRWMNVAEGNNSLE